MESLTNYIDISQFLPHRPPVLMVDKWLSINEKEVKTIFTIPSNCIFVANGQFQECGLIENAAQTCSTIVGETFISSYASPEVAKPVIGFISSIKKMMIFQLPNALETIVTHAKLLARLDTNDYCICNVKCEIYCQDVLLLDSVINLFIQELDEKAKCSTG